MRKFRKALMLGAAAAVLLSATAGGALAAGSMPSTVYFSLFGGAAMGSGSTGGWAHEVEGLDSNNNNYGWFEYADFSGSVGNGWLMGAALGTNLAPNVRAELELSYASLETTMMGTQRNGYFNTNFGNINFNNTVNFATNSIHDRLNATFILANLWYDFEPIGGITPYIGGGAGVAHVTGMFRGWAPNGNFSNPNDPVGYFNQSLDSWVPAFQVGVGAKIAVSPMIDFDIGYRYKVATNVPVMTATNAEVETSYNEVSAWGSNTTNMTLGVHAIQFGATFHF